MLTKLMIMKYDTNQLEINKVQKSKIEEVNFDNLVFGEIFTDHMFECDYANGEWQNPKIKPYGPIQLAPSAKVFHYGQAVFEGMKAYKDEDDQIWLFRPDENFKRINKSSARLAIPEFPEEFFFNGLEELLKLEKDWIKKGFGNSLYIRPFVIATEECVSANPATKYKFMIICSPAQAYYSGEVRVQFSEKYSRAADGGVGAAKAAGNYGASFYPAKKAQENGYQQLIWTDGNHHQFIEESGTMNIFFRRKDELVTPPLSDSILPGITRDSLIKLAEHHGIPCVQEKIGLESLVLAHKSGKITEAFGAGTAATVASINSITYKEEKLSFEINDDGFANKLKTELQDIQYGRTEDPFGWRVTV